MSQAVKCLILLAVVALLFVTELIPLAITATAGAIACGLLGFIPAKQVFSGLSNSTVVLFAGMFIVGAAMFYTGLAQKIGNTVVHFCGTGENSLMSRYARERTRFSPSPYFVVFSTFQYWYSSLPASGCFGYLCCCKDSCFPSVDAFGVRLRLGRYHYDGRHTA